MVLTNRRIYFGIGLGILATILLIFLFLPKFGINVFDYESEILKNVSAYAGEEIEKNKPIQIAQANYTDPYENISVTWQDQSLVFNHTPSNTWFSLEPIIIYNGNEMNAQAIRSFFPNIEFPNYVNFGFNSYKFYINITGLSALTQTQRDNIQKVGYKFKDSNNLNWDQVSLQADNSILIEGYNNNYTLSFYDMEESGFTVDTINKTHYLFGNVTNNIINNDILYLDPQITTSSDEGTSNYMSFKDQIFYDNNNDRWYVLYIDSGSDIHSQSAADSDLTTWTDGVDIDAGSYDYEDFDCVKEYDGSNTYLHCVYNNPNSDNLQYKRCELNSTSPYIFCGTEETPFDSSALGGQAADDVEYTSITTDSNHCVLILFSFEDDSVAVTNNEKEVVLIKEDSGTTCGDGDFDTDDIESGFPIYDVQDSEGYGGFGNVVAIESYGDLDAQLFYINTTVTSDTEFYTIFFNGTSNSVGTEQLISGSSQTGAGFRTVDAAIIGNDISAFSVASGTNHLYSYFYPDAKTESTITNEDTQIDIQTASTTGQSYTCAVDTNSLGNDTVYVFGVDDGDQQDIYVTKSLDGGKTWGTPSLEVDEAGTSEVKYLTSDFNPNDDTFLIRYINGSSSPFGIEVYLYETESSPCSGGSCTFDHEFIAADLRLDESLLSQGDSDTRIKFEIKELCSDTSYDSIDSATIQLYISSVGGSPDNDATIWYVENQTWDEDSAVGGFATEDRQNGSTETMTSTTANTFTNITATEQVQQACINGDDYITISLNDPDAGLTGYSSKSDGDLGIGNFGIFGTDNYHFTERENTNNSRKPKLYVSYTASSSSLNVTMNTTITNNSVYLAWYEDFYAEWFTDAGGTLSDCKIQINDTNYTANIDGTICNYTNSSMTDGNHTFIGYATYAGVTNKTETYWVYQNTTPEINATMNLTASDEDTEIILGDTAYFEWYMNDSDFTINNCLFEFNDSNYTANVDGIKCNYTVNADTFGFGQYNLRGYINTTTDKTAFTNSYALNITPDVNWKAKTRINDYSYNGNFSAYWTTPDTLTIHNCGVYLNDTSYAGTISGTDCSTNITGLSGNYTSYAWINDTNGNIGKTKTVWIYISENETLDGKWVLRAPVNETNIASGDSYACRYVDTGDPNYPCGNGQDTGVMWRNGTEDAHGFEERHCDNWGQFFMDETNISVARVDDIYCHLWVDQDSYVGVSGNATDSMYDAGSFVADSQTYPDDYGAQPDNATYYKLVIFNLTDINHIMDEQGDFLNFSVKVGGSNVQILTSNEQKSWCIYNYIGDARIDNDTQLQAQDTDGDGLNDYQELWVTYTDPYETDTDEDSYNDNFENNNGKKGYDPYDWGTIHKYYANSSNFTITYKTLNDQSSRPAFDSPTEVLANEISADQYQNMSTYGGGEADINLSLSTSGISTKYALAQINFKIAINESIDTINKVNLFYGGRNRIFSATSGEYNSSNIAYNESGGLTYLPGRYNPTYSRYVAQFNNLDDIDDIINDSNYIHYRWANIYSGRPINDAKTQLDFAEVWIITGSDYLDVTKPTTESPVTTTNNSNITIEFQFFQEGNEVTSGVDLENITIDSTLCPNSTALTYNTDHWEVNCTVPDVGDGYHNLTVYANSSANEFLSDTEIDSVYLEPENSCTYSGSGNWIINCHDYCNITSDTDLMGNILILNGTSGYVNFQASLYNFSYFLSMRCQKIKEVTKKWWW